MTGRDFSTTIFRTERSTAQLNIAKYKIGKPHGFPIFCTVLITAEAPQPSLQRLRRALKERYGEDIPQDFRDAFRQKSLPMMKYTNMLSFNTRTIAMFISVIIQVPWLYFAFELIVLNLMLAYMILTHEGFCRKFADQLEAK